MPIEFRCVQCQKLLRVGNDAAGKKARCPDCGTIQEARDSGGSLTGFSPKNESVSFPAPTLPVVPPFNPFSEQATPGSSFGQAAANPYLAPQTPGTPPPASREFIQNKVRTPAICLLVLSGVMSVLQLAAGVAILVTNAGRRGTFEELVINLIGIVVGLTVSITIALGALRMQRLESYGLAVTAAVLSIIPCTSSCCLLSIPLGIWCLIVLLDPQVKQAFR